MSFSNGNEPGDPLAEQKQSPKNLKPWHLLQQRLNKGSENDVSSSEAEFQTFQELLNSRDPGGTSPVKYVKPGHAYSLESDELSFKLAGISLSDETLLSKGEEPYGPSSHQDSNVTEQITLPDFDFSHTGYDYGLPPPEVFDIVSHQEVSKNVEDIKQEEDLRDNVITPKASTNLLAQAADDPKTPPEKVTVSIPGVLDGELEEASQHVGDLAEFSKEFERLSIDPLFLKSERTAQSKPILVMVVPLSYKHAFARSWVTKSYISSIVERPQRLMACSIGIAAALMKSPTSIRVETCSKRTSLEVPHVERVHGASWGKKLYQLCSESPGKLAKREIEVPDGWHSGDLYLSPGTIDALEGVVAAVEAGVDSILQQNSLHDRAFLTVRPPGHHCHPEEPSGFCLLNNAHIAIQYAAANHGITHAIILDFDLHHGDGSQDICWRLAGFQDNSDEQESDPASVTNEGKTDNIKGPKVGYFSLHDINSFPTETGYATEENIKNASVCLMAHDMCVWNIHLEEYETEVEFNEIYNTKYSALFGQAKKFLETSRKASLQNKKEFKPLVVISAGFDASEFEGGNMQRHSVHVPTSFYHRFTADSVALAEEYSQGKILSLLEGGYSDAALSTGVFSHILGLSGKQWDSSWLDKAVAKEFDKGCKLKWNAPPVDTWISIAIGLGRKLWPLEVQQQVTAATTGRRRTAAAPVNRERELLVTPSRVLRDRKKKAN